MKSLDINAVLLAISLFQVHVPVVCHSGSVLDKSQVQYYVNINLVDKNWLPNSFTAPVKTVEEAFKIVLDDDSVYKFKSRKLSRGIELFTNPNYGYQPKLDSILVLNPPTAEGNDFADGTVTALALRNYLTRFNVFTVHFGKAGEAMDSTVALNILGFNAKYGRFAESIGTVFAEAMSLKLIKASQINIIAFCYSSQLAGFIGRYIKETMRQKIRSILGLDPYSVGFADLTRVSLSEDDAEIVHIYHTNSLGIGTMHRHGTADFIFNGGNYQPGCFRNKALCSHSRAIKYAWLAIMYPDLFLARSCSNHYFFSACLCRKNSYKALSYPLHSSAKGKYYLKTSRSMPYGRGRNSAACRKQPSMFKPRILQPRNS